MKYTRKINKHYEYISQEDYLGSDSGIKRLVNACALLEGGCCHFFACNKHFQGATELKNQIQELAFSESLQGEADELIKVYSSVLTSLCAYKSVTKEKSADQTIGKCASYLLSCGFDRAEELALTKQSDFSRALSSCYALSEYYALTKDQNAHNLLNFISRCVSKLNISSASGSTYDYLNLCLGLARFAIYSGESAVNSVIGELFDNFLVNAQSLNYGASTNFGEKKECDGATSAKSFELALCMFSLTQDQRYLTMARRIWFNGLQFCQRELGQVGSDTFTNEKTRLKVVNYQIKQVVTPLYATALKCYESNKKIFYEDERIVKDRNGRIFMGDKMFAKDVSGFFGRDLIEIPTLTAFDKETALQLDFSLVF